MPNPKRYTLEDIQTHNRVAGFYFFSPDTMRCFKSRILAGVWRGPGGIYFCTSEKGPHGPRHYNVRRYDPATGNIDNNPDSCIFPSAYDARRVAELLAKTWKQDRPPLFWHPLYGWMQRNAAHVYAEKSLYLGAAFGHLSQELPKGGRWRRAHKRKKGSGWVIQYVGAR